MQSAGKRDMKPQTLPKSGYRLCTECAESARVPYAPGWTPNTSGEWLCPKCAITAAEQDVNDKLRELTDAVNHRTKLLRQFAKGR
jgi:hypothetical protein